MSNNLFYVGTINGSLYLLKIFPEEEKPAMTVKIAGGGEGGRGTIGEVILDEVAYITDTGLCLTSRDAMRRGQGDSETSISTSDIIAIWTSSTSAFEWFNNYDRRKRLPWDKRYWATTKDALESVGDRNPSIRLEHSVVVMFKLNESPKFFNVQGREGTQVARRIRAKL